MPRAQAAENLLHQERIINNRDDTHRVMADRAAQKVHEMRLIFTLNRNPY